MILLYCCIMGVNFTSSPLHVFTDFRRASSASASLARLRNLSMCGTISAEAIHTPIRTEMKIMMLMDVLETY
ncbi:MAG: hypothetical protein P8123_03305 [bacterium]